MEGAGSFLAGILNPTSVVTPIPNGVWFPESLEMAKGKYAADIALFIELVGDAHSSADLLERIRSGDHGAKTRMSLLKLYRRCVSLILDTETTSKITKFKTEDLIRAYGSAFFKPIHTLKRQFNSPDPEIVACLAALLAENDFRGQQGYQLTEQFFDWFEAQFPELVIRGPRRAGRDVELRSIFPEYSGNFPCDFVIGRKGKGGNVLAIGFARYDSTRGGSQSDDRTSGNANKVGRAQAFCEATGHRFKMIFLADGPGLVHRDTWEEACALDDSWNGNVLVTTLKLAPRRITRDWLLA